MMSKFSQRICPVCLAGLILLTGVTGSVRLLAQGGVEEFAVEDIYTSRNRIAVNENGGILAVGSSFGVFKAAARTYTPEGIALTGAWELNSKPPHNFNLRPDAVALEDTSFLVAWDQNTAVYAQIYSVSGVSGRPAFKVNTADQSDNSPIVAANSKGEAAIVWGFNNAGSRGLRARFLDPERNFVGDPFPTLGGLGRQTDREAVMREDGALAITWKADSTDGTTWIELALYGQDGKQITRTLVDGGSLEAETQVQTPDVGTDARNNLTVTWNRVQSDGTFVVLAQRFDTDLQSLGDPVPIPAISSRPRQPSSSTDPAGRTVVAWLEEDRNEIYYAVANPGPLVFLDPVRVAAGGETLLSLSEIELDPSGRIAIAWGRQGEGTLVTPQQLPELPQVKSPFVQWQQRQAAGVDVSTDADFDEDGLSSVLEYAFGTDPQLPDDLGALLSVDVVDGSAVVSARLRVDSALSLSLEVSRDLVSWQSSESIPGFGQDNSPGDEGFETIRFSFPVQSHQFFRVTSVIEE